MPPHPLRTWGNKFGRPQQTHKFGLPSPTPTRFENLIRMTGTESNKQLVRQSGETFKRSDFEMLCKRYASNAGVQGVPGQGT